MVKPVELPARLLDLETSNAQESHELPSPWHEGERAMHERLGVAERMERAGRRSIHAFTSDQHRAFFAQLPFLLVGSVDESDWPWVSLLSGPAGFATSPYPRRLDIAALPISGDPLSAALEPGAQLGLLGIELPTRRRNRVNGRVIGVTDGGFSIAVDQSFGNCPQYIRRRDYGVFRRVSVPRIEAFTGLDAAARKLIQQADTFFVASSAAGDGTAPGRGVDVSHRGGPAGFLKFGADGAIVVPDYRGNRFFNTLGNLTVNPRAGLLFVDFDQGDLLQLTGETRIVWDGPEVTAAAGAERIWRLLPLHGRWLRGALPLHFAPG